MHPYKQKAHHRNQQPGARFGNAEQHLLGVKGGWWRKQCNHVVDIVEIQVAIVVCIASNVSRDSNNTLLHQLQYKFYNKNCLIHLQLR